LHNTNDDDDDDDDEMMMTSCIQIDTVLQHLFTTPFYAELSVHLVCTYRCHYTVVCVRHISSPWSHWRSVWSTDLAYHRLA